LVFIRAPEGFQTFCDNPELKKKLVISS